MQNSMQPVVQDEKGVCRFKENKIVTYILDTNPNRTLNEIAIMDFSDDDKQHLYQLIGCSVSGYGELSYADDSVYDASDAQAQQFINADKKNESAHNPQPTAQQPEPEKDDENLDLRVWLAMGGNVQRLFEKMSPDPHMCRGTNGECWIYEAGKAPEQWQPTKNWAQLGPLIERFGVSISRQTKTPARPFPNWNASIEYPIGFEGENAMIAACRAIASYKPEVPNEE